MKETLRWRSSYRWGNRLSEEGTCSRFHSKAEFMPDRLTPSQHFAPHKVHYLKGVLKGMLKWQDPSSATLKNFISKMMFKKESVI